MVEKWYRNEGQKGESLHPAEATAFLRVFPSHQPTSVQLQHGKKGCSPAVAGITSFDENAPGFELILRGMTCGLVGSLDASAHPLRQILPKRALAWLALWCQDLVHLWWCFIGWVWLQGLDSGWDNHCSFSSSSSSSSFPYLHLLGFLLLLVVIIIITTTVLFFTNILNSTIFKPPISNYGWSYI